MTKPAAIALLASTALFACVTDDADDAVTPDLGGGKADATDHVTERGALSFAAPSTGAFGEDLQFDGYRLAVRDGAEVRLEVTHAGTASKLDTTMFVYGPCDGDRCGTEAIAFDDDSGWSKHSRLRGLELAGGEYLVVIGTHDARGRGNYRLVTTCENDACEPLPPEPAACVFGDTYRDHFHSPALATTRRRVIDSSTTLTAIEQQQIIGAAQASAAGDSVQTIADAFDAADEGEFNQVELWDRTSNRAYVIYEFGAGDTSVGAYFVYGTTQRVAVIGDGDLEECSAAAGVAGDDCTQDTECEVGSCVGRSDASGIGRCTDLTGFGESTPCSASAPCDLAQGMACAGLTRGDEGLCQPAWMFGNYGELESGVAVPDGAVAGATRTVDVHGLGTVDTDVSLRLWVSHDAPSQLTATLVNPAGTEVVVFDGATANANELSIDGPVLGFSGDESVNGTWTLRVVDDVAGSTGTIERWTLSIASRLD
ncbi:MAG TPA: proprotein convertase P-domain-containing protein [Nannocystaceae bacterium]|nr:proprotein convertase P-domain-containing protein [Nannocystaceae bacterium]